MKNLRIVYMGTPDFAVAPLKALLEAGCNVVGVVTNPDKPAGRGQKIICSAVKKFAEEKQLPILQPEKFRDKSFLQSLKAWQADLQIVVAFKMLPEVVWAMPKMGTVNLHASLLPQYRGAAPINHAIINGEQKTGITTFLLKHEIDTGDMLLQEEVAISPTDTAGSLHDKLMEKGAKLIVKTVEILAKGDYRLLPQKEEEFLKPAPKIFREDCKIDWNKNGENIYNHIRGLCPYPAAWTNLLQEDSSQMLKIYECRFENGVHSFENGKLLSTKKEIKVAVKGGYLFIEKLQLAGKKAMDTESFLRGYSFKDDAKLA